MNESVTDSYSELDFITVIIPCRNEGVRIKECVESVANNGYPLDRMEILVVDGCSTDNTLDVLAGLMKAIPPLRVLNNPKRITPAALNLGIRHARGKYVLRLDGHAGLEPGYIQKALSLARASNAANVGGVMRTLPGGTGAMALAIAEVLSSRLGVGPSVFRTGTHKAQWVDTVFGGFYRREVLDLVGSFNEDLSRGQDHEFNRRLVGIEQTWFNEGIARTEDLELNRRLRARGANTLLDPSLVSYYYAKHTWKGFARQNWTNGVWAILPFAYSSVIPVGLRHLTPLLAIIGGVCIALVGLIGISWTPFLVVTAIYLLLGFSLGIAVGIRTRKVEMVVLVPFTLATLHLSYGLGSAWGVTGLAGLLLRQRRGSRANHQNRGDAKATAENVTKKAS